jgi:ribonuclease-3 family protein
MSVYHQKVVACVRAEQQAHFLSLIEAELTEAEREVVRRGRNSVTKIPKRLDHATYQHATGFEALVGYLYLTNADRLAEVFACLTRVLSE